MVYNQRVYNQSMDTERAYYLEYRLNTVQWTVYNVYKILHNKCSKSAIAIESFSFCLNRYNLTNILLV